MINPVDNFFYTVNINTIQKNKMICFKIHCITFPLSIKKIILHQLPMPTINNDINATLFSSMLLSSFIYLLILYFSIVLKGKT